MCRIQNNFRYKCKIGLGKKGLLYLIFLSLLLLITWWMKYHRPLIHANSVKLTYVTVHLDLKGSPPKISYLLSLLPIFSLYGVNSILLEYEDMFPYDGSIVNISSVHSYKKVELMTFLNKAKLLDIEVIPLIQTFGHMEFVLKLKEFAHLREEAMYPNDICPSNPLSRTVISNMLEQVITLHAQIRPLKHIHIGCDEVRFLNKCNKCEERGLRDIALFFDHVKEISTRIKKLNPNMKVLLWSDMFQNNKKQSQIALLNDIEAVTWDYNHREHFSHTEFYNLHQQFDSIWIASAYKGADGMNALVPNIKNRFLNHLNWMRYILGYRFGGESEVYNFKGIILTGWSRYTHMSVQCELMPIAMASLILNLLLVKAVRNGIDPNDLHNLEYCQFYEKYLKQDFEKIFVSYGKTDTKCSFENTQLYDDLQNDFDQDKRTKCMTSLRLHESECILGEYIDIYNMELAFKRCDDTLRKYSALKRKLTTFMNKYYKPSVVNSYVDANVIVHVRIVKNLIEYLKNCTKVRYWNKRH